MDDNDRDSQSESFNHEPTKSKAKPLIIVGVVLVVVLIGAWVVPKVLRPSLSVNGSSVDVQKQIAPLLTQSNLNLVMDLAKPVLSNIARGGAGAVIITSSPPAEAPAPTPAPTNPPAASNPPPQIIIVQPPAVTPAPAPTPPATNAPPEATPVRAAGPRFEIFPMPRTGALPAANAAPLAHWIDSQELFRGSRFTTDAGVNAYRSQDLWLKWSGRISVATAGTHTFFHALNMDRHLPADGRKRPTDFGGRGRQRVVTHLYIDGVKLDSKDKRFSEIEGSLRTQFGVQLAPGLHSIELWMGVNAEEAPYVYDEVSMTLELRSPNQSVPGRLPAADLGW